MWMKNIAVLDLVLYSKNFDKLLKILLKKTLNF